jgi:fucose permease
LNLIQVQGYTATEAGAAFFPLILLLFLLSRWAGGLVKRYGARLPLIIGSAITAVGYALFFPAKIGGSYWTTFFPPIFVLGLGMAVCVAPLTTLVMNSIAQSHVGAASGVNNAISRIAGLLAIAILGLVMITLFNQQLAEKLKASSIPSHIQQEILAQRSQLADIKTEDQNAHRLVQEAFIVGYKAIVWVAVIMSLASALSAALLIDDEASEIKMPSSHTSNIGYRFHDD